MSLSPFLLSVAVVGVLIFLVNLTFLLLVYHKGSLKKLQNALVFSLACSDLCTGVFSIPMILLCNIANGDVDCPICITAYLLNHFYFSSTVMHLLSVVCERYVKIMYPFCFDNSGYMRRLRSARVVPALWLFSFVISAIPLSWLNNCVGDSYVYTKYYDYAFMTLVSVFLALMILAFIRIYLVVRSHLSNIRAITVPLAAPSDGQSLTDDFISKPEGTPVPLRSRQQSSDYDVGSDTKSTNGGLRNACQKSRRYWLIKEARIIIRFATMVFVYILGWGTYVVISTQEQRGQEVSRVVQQIFTFAHFLSPLVNPLIMSINNRDFHGTWAELLEYIYRMVALCRSPQSPSNSPGDEITVEQLFYTTNV